MNAARRRLAMVACVIAAVIGTAGCGSAHETPGLQLLKSQNMAFYTPTSATITNKSTEYYHKCNFAAFAQTCHDSVDWMLIPKLGATPDVVSLEVRKAAALHGWIEDPVPPSKAIAGTPMPKVIMKKDSRRGPMQFVCILDAPPTPTHLLCELTFPEQPSLNRVGS